MIKTPLFIVTGKREVKDDVIFTRKLVFSPKVVELSRLVIAPKKGAASGAQRVLKIVADEIVTPSPKSGCDAEITYNLDGDITVPVVTTGLDPYTKAKNGRKGDPDYSHGLGPVPADRAQPNFDPVLDLAHYVGGYPKAEDGGDGKPGGKGGKGTSGMNGPILEIWTKKITGNGLIVDLRGQEGGDGGRGGNGQFGGNGQMGSQSATGTGETWTGLPTAVCNQRAGLGGDGGRGGDAGCGGDGGDGGNGGVLKLFYTSNVSPSKITPMLQGGKGGKTGSGGQPGEGGKPGPPGLTPLPPCVPALSSAKGPTGLSCHPQDEGKVISQPGQDGAKGYAQSWLVAEIPKVPGLWP